MTDREADIAEIVRLHTEWMESNNGLDIPRMIPNFADPGYHQFNLNGFTYDLPEKVRLWEGLHELGSNLVMKKLAEPTVFLDQDLAYLIDEYDIVMEGRAQSGTMPPPSPVPVRARMTEVYRRDDGHGEPVWKIWHFHCSLAAGPGTFKYPQEMP